MAIDPQRRKELYRLVPEGALTSRNWLRLQNLSSHAIDNSVKSKQLETIKNGIYKREGADVEWGDVVYFLQSVHGSDFIVGGISSLELQKLSHYLSLSERRTIHLYGLDNVPVWINIVSKQASFKKHSKGGILGAGFTKEHAAQLDNFITTYPWRNAKRSAAWAILEVLYQVPHTISFEHADELMQGLNTLPPRSMQKLLELCKNMKVRRLFFYLSERHNHPWLSKLDKAALDFGSGNRVIVEGGKLDKNYQITIPESYE
ncbi:type IV toxin-antitoxin system AbiEi family antitoxin domain-containing protein [Pedobacter sp. Leaf194]|uniref:type IV toxin-antitoxin system AbiEi family antitoxin domain-containing protein n=1 Tax=Pedobacter sp. Leaf194 TaxID=1736297 RepID=UPI0007033408|nr:type IV toxin-antitoxin system AbiEi family antitoxin domain-containing protein [Pedobacter sp. Leaf194]KQS36187.1 hypothetical protein ASG14_12200 [Pedobacter sp. Leaf194]